MLDCELGYEDEPFQVGGAETTKLVDAVVRKRLDCEDARVVDDMVDRAELADRSLCDLVGSGCLTDVPVDERQVRRRREVGLGNTARGCDDVITAI